MHAYSGSAELMFTDRCQINAIRNEIENAKFIPMPDAQISFLKIIIKTCKLNIFWD